MAEACENCTFWRRNSGGNIRLTSGKCVIHAPERSGKNGRGVWPITAETDYCGMWLGSMPPNVVPIKKT